MSAGRSRKRCGYCLEGMMVNESGSYYTTHDYLCLSRSVDPREEQEFEGSHWSLVAEFDLDVCGRSRYHPYLGDYTPKGDDSDAA